MEIHIRAADLSASSARIVLGNVPALGKNAKILVLAPVAKMPDVKL